MNKTQDITGPDKSPQTIGIVFSHPAGKAWHRDRFTMVAMGQGENVDDGRGHTSSPQELQSPDELDVVVRD